MHSSLCRSPVFSLLLTRQAMPKSRRVLLHFQKFAP